MKDIWLFITGFSFSLFKTLLIDTKKPFIIPNQDVQRVALFTRWANISFNCGPVQLSTNRSMFCHTQLCLINKSVLGFANLFALFHQGLVNKGEQKGDELVQIKRRTEKVQTKKC